VSSADLVGGREDELQVIVDPQLLAARTLTIEDLRLALVNQNQDTSGGDLWEGKRRYVIRTLGQFRSPEQVEGVIITRRDGKPVYVRDVAKARLGTKKPEGVVRRFGSNNIAIRVTRESGANVLDVMPNSWVAQAKASAAPLSCASLIGSTLKSPSQTTRKWPVVS
jgi:HAE1 family hydrophobic/amphiphilic exporter-1